MSAPSSSTMSDKLQVMTLASHGAEMTRKNKVERVLYML